MGVARWLAVRTLTARLLVPFIGCALVAHATSATRPAVPVLAVDSIGLTVSDLDRSVRFFTEVLDFEPVDEFELAGDGIEHLSGVFGARLRVARLRLGDERIELTEYLASAGRPLPADSRSHDGWFQHIAIVVTDMNRAYDRLREHGAAHASTGPQRLPAWNPQAGGISAFYFRDPDGHALEIIHFPADKGDPRWQGAGNRLFLGIDHTAIVVRDTEASLRFWVGALGLGTAGASENWGTEQEHLNNVFGARLRITALRAADGPGIEFLEYLAPSDGRPYPLDSRGSDLWHWQTRLRVVDAEASARDARRAGGRWISPGEVALPESPLGTRAAAQVRDPDGHALVLAEP